MTYPAITLPEMLEQTAAKYGSETALIYFGARISYAQLQAEVHRLAAGLQSIGVPSPHAGEGRLRHAVRSRYAPRVRSVSL